jgi:hypothetical protein
MRAMSDSDNLSTRGEFKRPVVEKDSSYVFTFIRTKLVLSNGTYIPIGENKRFCFPKYHNFDSRMYESEVPDANR